MFTKQKRHLLVYQSLRRSLNFEETFLLFLLIIQLHPGIYLDYFSNFIANRNQMVFS
jgi:hypothetical protein